jgi:anti-sigma factor RsiW
VGAIVRASVSCGRARRVLWPEAGPKAVSSDVIEAREHVTECVACRQFFSEMAAFGTAIQDAAPREQAPANVRESLFRAIAHARAGVELNPDRRVRRSRVAVAAMALAIVGGAIATAYLLRDSSSDPISALAADHASTVVSARIASSDPAEISQWLSRQVHFAMYVPVLPGAQLRGARLCIMDGRRGAVVEYEVDSVAVSYFVVPNGRTGITDREVAGFDLAARAGYRIVSWREPGLLHAMVGALPESRLAMLAKACVEQAQRAVAWVRQRSFGRH